MPCTTHADHQTRPPSTLTQAAREGCLAGIYESSSHAPDASSRGVELGASHVGHACSLLSVHVNAARVLVSSSPSSCNFDRLGSVPPSCRAVAKALRPDAWCVHPAEAGVTDSCRLRKSFRNCPSDTWDVKPRHRSSCRRAFGPLRLQKCRCAFGNEVHAGLE